MGLMEELRDLLRLVEGKVCQLPVKPHIRDSLKMYLELADESLNRGDLKLILGIVSVITDRVLLQLALGRRAAKDFLPLMADLQILQQELLLAIGGNSGKYRPDGFSELVPE